MTNIEQKSIFIGGVPRSGTTLTKNFLNKHYEITAFGETKLIDNELFLTFPTSIYECPIHQRSHLLEIFKQTCLTLLYCRLMFPRDTVKERVWLWYEKLWGLRSESCQSFFWNNIFWKILEKAWLSLPPKNFIHHSPISHSKNNPPKGWRGLYAFFDKEDIKQCFIHLNPLKEVKNLDEACCLYGKFWSELFNTRVRKYKKKYWAEKTPNNVIHSLFLERCFRGFKIINLIRDGRDVACSSNTAWSVDIKKSLDMWAKQLRWTMKVQESLAQNQYINIRYEDLVLDTGNTLRKITDFLEIDFDDDLLSLSISSNSIGRYMEEFDRELKNYSKKRYGSLFKYWGYSI